MKTIGLPLQISLSGGKDSRAILAILDRAGCFDDTVQVETQGHWYDPEVLAAQDLMELYQHPADRHAVIRPSYVDSPEHLVPALVDTLFAWEGNMSLADREKYRLDNGHLTVGGHELGMKYWGNPAPLETYVKSPVFKVNTSGPFAIRTSWRTISCGVTSRSTSSIQCSISPFYACCSTARRR